ncbi:hypothetical protein AA0313_1708 [Acetobacter indonesiensis NRIC 0313]|uniref:Uncharacterized protein n=1 Tax=Acetobacter indonesiensis TaxID=104101 RepID=A0A6N3T6J7_9PROT|nr:hypothetical protein Abin_002_132 [Acetobacter indonesiensis]GBQ58159.1 hypothetical protein AA0313_1708 [Acetobacter indonesiensis NRIC 0313]GEN03580.1 hypothetical protein AIN02nite_16050 [Acetobacter indonesiensis]
MGEKGCVLAYGAQPAVPGWRMRDIHPRHMKSACHRMPMACQSRAQSREIFLIVSDSQKGQTLA